jgi:hypothetical protein
LNRGQCNKIGRNGGFDREDDGDVGVAPDCVKAGGDLMILLVSNAYSIAKTKTFHFFSPTNE